MKCKDCNFWVEETDKIGDYQHEEAVKRKEGFCLMKELFTMQEPEYECDCGE